SCGCEPLEPFVPPIFLPIALNGAATCRAMTSRRVVYASPLFLWRKVYFLLTFSTEMTVSDIQGVRGVQEVILGVDETAAEAAKRQTANRGRGNVNRNRIQITSANPFS